MFEIEASHHRDGADSSQGRKLKVNVEPELLTMADETPRPGRSGAEPPPRRRILSFHTPMTAGASSFSRERSVLISAFTALIF